MTLAIDRMTPTAPKILQKAVTFDEFMAWYPDPSEFRYELRRGVIFQMPKPKGDHSQVAGFTHDELAFEIRQKELPYFIPKECIIKRFNDTGYEPDVVVLDSEKLDDEPRWHKESTIEQGTSIKLVIEVVSTNWQDDYETKLAEYEAIGIPEYWIVDYAGLSGIRHIGSPNQATLTICTLINGEYETQQFRGDEVIVSIGFPELTLTAAQILRGGRRG
jgi:Uma2 family endonuclease